MGSFAIIAIASPLLPTPLIKLVRRYRGASVDCERGEGRAFVCVRVPATEWVSPCEAAQYGDAGVSWEMVCPNYEAHLVVVVWSGAIDIS